MITARKHDLTYIICAPIPPAFSRSWGSRHTGQHRKWNSCQGRVWKSSSHFCQRDGRWQTSTCSSSHFWGAAQTVVLVLSEQKDGRSVVWAWSWSCRSRQERTTFTSRAERASEQFPSKARYQLLWVLSVPTSLIPAALATACVRKRHFHCSCLLGDMHCHKTLHLYLEFRGERKP